MDHRYQTTIIRAAGSSTSTQASIGTESSLAENLNNNATSGNSLEDYKTAIKASADWEMYLNCHYDNEEVLSIMGMLSYLVNCERGFGHMNNEHLFKEERDNDTTGKLYEEALKGFEFSKRCISIKSANGKSKFPWKYSFNK